MHLSTWCCWVLFADQLIPEHPKSPYYIVPLHAVAMHYRHFFMPSTLCTKSLSSIEKAAKLT
ncbi:MAG: hypothetical protein H6558_01215 [Lewinellaceae bacterium]|nr:hypothetical protein [Lewinellaceae bacterium]